ncbi:hypothetical protein [Streptomyces fractus]|uniref:hypothetical protein n=1 Tax=Streptomyces fractus TaxID=641806 RepID=UPI003CF10A7F
MTEDRDPAHPRTTPRRRTRRPTFAKPADTVPVQALDDIAPDLDPPWTKDDLVATERTVEYVHPDGHRIGLRAQDGSGVVQAWITAGPHLPPIPDGTEAEQAAAQAANDARLQPHRTWNAALTLQPGTDPRQALSALVRDQLIPALTHKPKHVRPRSPATPDSAPTPDTAEPTPPEGHTR